MSSDRYLTERLPWYLNGSLDEAERAELEGLLAQSAENRAELAETEAAARIYGHRLPSEVVVGYAFDGEHPEVPTELLERYFEVSPVGADELRLLRESKAELEEELATESADAGVVSCPGPAPAAVSGWRRMALAASLVGVAALGLTGWQWMQVRESENQLAVVERQLREALAQEEAPDTAPVGDAAARARLEALEREAEELAAGKSDLVEQIEAKDQEIERLGSQVAELSQPLVNVAVIDLFPGDRVLRGEEAPSEPEIVVPRQTRTVTLILNSSLESDRRVTGMQILGADGGRVWRSTTRPERDTHGTFTVAIPVTALETGVYTLQLVDSRDGQTEIVETYSLEIR